MVVVSISLLFAGSMPRLGLCWVDAALDNINVKKVCAYVKSRSKDFQCIVISLKDQFYHEADSLVGIAKNCATTSSISLTVDLTKYDAGDDDDDDAQQ